MSKKWYIVGGIAGIVVVALVLGLSLGLTLGKKDIKQIFISRCEERKGNDCQTLWTVFEQAYVGKDPCKVHPEAYNALIAAAPMKAECNKMMFWSKTKKIVDHYTSKRRDCHVAMNDNLLGYVLDVDDLTWCGKEGSIETFTRCGTDCDNKPKQSFWKRASAEYAKLACGEVTVMLSGSENTPFNSTSIFATDEVNNFNPYKMNKLQVVLVKPKKQVSNCADPSLEDLQKKLPQVIAYNCKEVAESQIKDCASNPGISCGSCW